MEKRGREQGNFPLATCKLSLLARVPKVLNIQYSPREREGIKGVRAFFRIFRTPACTHLFFFPLILARYFVRELFFMKFYFIFFSFLPRSLCWAGDARWQLKIFNTARTKQSYPKTLHQMYSKLKKRGGRNFTVLFLIVWPSMKKPSSRLEVIHQGVGDKKKQPKKESRKESIPRR